MPIKYNDLFSGILKLKMRVIWPRYGQVFNFKYSPVIGSHNNCTVMNVLDDATDDVRFGQINKTVLDVNVTKLFLIIFKVKVRGIGTYHNC